MKFAKTQKIKEKLLILENSNTELQVYSECRYQVRQSECADWLKWSG